MTENRAQYDADSETVREWLGAAGCILIVFQGEEGNGIGFSVPDEMRPHLPAMFRSMAAEIEEWLVVEANAMTCPHCSQVMSFGRQPVPTRASTVCIRCTALLRRDGSEWVLMSSEDILALPDEERLFLQRVRREIHRLHEEAED